MYTQCIYAAHRYMHMPKANTKQTQGLVVSAGTARRQDEEGG